MLGIYSWWIVINILFLIHIITKQDLLNYVFVESGYSGNREYFKLGKFEVSQHLGKTFHVRSNGINSYSEDWNTIKDLDIYYKQWSHEQLEKISSRINKLLQDQRTIINTLYL